MKSRKRYKLWKKTKNNLITVQARCFLCYYINEIPYAGYLYPESVLRSVEAHKCLNCKQLFKISRDLSLFEIIRQILKFEGVVACTTRMARPLA